MRYKMINSLVQYVVSMCFIVLFIIIINADIY